MKRILVCEDEDVIRDFVVINLKRAGYDVCDVGCGEDALRVFEEEHGNFDIVLLDIMMPGIDGFTVCKKLREKSSTIGIIMLTARTQEMDKVSGLMFGADDYITKPFGIMELLSRVKAVLRRSGGKTAQKQGQLSCQGLLLDLDRRTASYESTEIVLTYKEFELLAYLMRNRGTAVSRDRLLEEVWGFQYEGETRTVDAHIKTLRQKLEAAECRNLIGTVRGYGYKIGG